MKNNKVPYKKSIRMLQKYKQKLSEPNIESEDTVDNELINLEASYVARETKLENIPVQKKSINLIIKDWLKENWVGAIFFAVIVVLLQWGIEAKIDFSEIKTRIEYIDETVNQLDDNYARKEEVKSEMENIRILFNNSSYTDLKEIKEKLDKLENIINNQ